MIIEYRVPQYDGIALFAMRLTCALLLLSALYPGNVEMNIVLPETSKFVSSSRCSYSFPASSYPSAMPSLIGLSQI
jgi:hypothetical protein